MRLVGLLALFSGVALLIHILSGISLGLALGVATAIVLLAFASIWFGAGAVARGRIRSLLRIGSISGVVATLAYDLAKLGLSRLDPSPFDPFGALPVFGQLLLGDAAGPSATLAAGAAVHLLNGVSFGVAYCFLLGDRGVVAGIVWGLFLETFQLTLYPGWLDIRLLREFVQVSGLSHVVYGAVLGSLCRRALANRGKESES